MSKRSKENPYNDNLITWCEVSAYEPFLEQVHNASLPTICTALTGLDVEAFRSRCVTYKSGAFPREACPWAWRFFAENGYRTMLLEDWPHSGLFNIAAAAAPHYWPTQVFDAAYRDTRTSSNADVRECLGSRSQSQFLAAYLTSFGLTFASANSPYFAVVWSHALTTNISTAKHVDDTFADALRRILDAGALRETVVLVTSEPNDLEHPALIITVPDWLRKNYSEHLERLDYNRGRLTTPRDLYATFADIVYPPFVSFMDFRGFEGMRAVMSLKFLNNASRGKFTLVAVIGFSIRH